MFHDPNCKPEQNPRTKLKREGPQPFGVKDSSQLALWRRGCSMGRTPTRVLLHLALLYFFIPPAAGGGGGGLTAKASGSKGIDCSAAVRPVDAVPLRSPQAVHSVLATEYFAGKHIVEIGTRNGDGISCFSKTAASAIAFEAKKTYCQKLEARQKFEHSRYTVRCTIFGGPDMGTMPDADVFTWWVGYGALDVQLLHELCRSLSCGKLRTNATAVVLFEHNEKYGMSSLRHLRHIGSVAREQRVPFDETEHCRALLRANNSDLLTVTKTQPFVCDRARGNITLATFPIARLAALSPLECQCNARQTGGLALQQLPRWVFGWD